MDMNEEDDNEFDEESTVVTTQSRKPQERNPLAATQKKLKSLSVKALKLAEKILDDEKNEVYDVKTQIDAAKFVTTKYLEVSDSITKAAISKLVLEQKERQLAGGNMKTIGQSEAPKAVFTTSILCHEKTSEEYVPPEEGKYDAGDWKTL